MNAVALVILVVSSAAALPLWGDLPPLPRMQVRAGVVLLTATAALAAAALLGWHAPARPGFLDASAPVLAVLAAVAAGGPVVTATLRLADRGRRPPGVPGPADPQVLAGGAWIGGLERLAVAASLVAGWPEGVALALAVKGLGRYPELRAPAAAERFIIGTFASVLWAAGCAGVSVAVQR